jgi:hypothetical protein
MGVPGASFERTSARGGWESFFERLHGVGILLVGLGPGAHVREAHLQSPINRIVRDREAELLVQKHAGSPLEPDAVWLDELTTDAEATTENIARREGCSVRKVNMAISLAFLAPDLVRAAIEGRLG